MKKYLPLLVLPAIFVVNSANASILLSNTTDIISNGQLNSADYGTSGFENFSDISLNVHAVGDYGQSESSEYINFKIDGTDFGSFRYDTASVTATQVGSHDFDWDLQFSILISDTQWANFISDSALNITWSNGAGTNFNSFPQHFVNYEMNGNPVSSVPIPAAVWLFGSGFIGLIGMRKELSTLSV